MTKKNIKTEIEKSLKIAKDLAFSVVLEENKIIMPNFNLRYYNSISNRLFGSILNEEGDAI